MTLRKPALQELQQVVAGRKWPSL